MALRETIDTYHHNGAKIALGIDTGGPVGGDHVVSIASGDWRSDSDDGGWFINRWFFFDEWSERYARNFAEKIATDEEYRSQSLTGNATWKRVEDAYEETAREVYREFQSRNLLSYTAGDSDEKRAYRKATREMESICESLFYGLKQRLRDPGGVDENEPVAIDDFERTILDEARTKAEEIDYCE
jgi:hypothetical protein